MKYIGDTHKLTTFDGQELIFPFPEIKLLAYGNYGAPPTQFITRRGYKQHGSTEVDFLLDSRSIDLTLWHSPACNRQQYWDTRLALHEILRPNRGGPMTLTLIQPNGEQRALIVRADPGLTFPPDTDNNWGIDDTIGMIAFDPVWFDPDTTDTSYDMQDATNTDLVFPITFPIVFGLSGVIFTTGVISYPGTWETYPIFTLTGPYLSVTIENLTTGIVISLVVAITEDDTRIIDLTPGAQRVVDGNGQTRYNELGTDSNLIDFSIQPAPLVPNGQQTIRVTMFGGSITLSSAHISYYNRYFAI